MSQLTIWYNSLLWIRKTADYRINRDYNGDTNDFGGYFFVYEKFAKTPVLAILGTRSKGARAVITREPRAESYRHPELVSGSATKASRSLREFPSQNVNQASALGGTFQYMRACAGPKAFIIFVMGAFYFSFVILSATKNPG